MTITPNPSSDSEAIKAPVEAWREQPSLGKVTFNMKSRATGGVALENKTGPILQNGNPDASRNAKFPLTSDEPVALLGTDTGVSPAEYALKALAGCYAVTLTSLSASRGIQLDKIAMALNFDIDLNGFLGIDRSVRIGALAIPVTIQLERDGTRREQMKHL